MALIPNKKEFVQSVGIIIEVDTTVQDMLFPAVKLHKTQEITYDMAVVEGETVAFNSFANTSKTIVKDGKNVVTIAPVNLNNSISKDEIDANALKFGQSEYGDENIDPEMESALNGVGKIRLNHMATGKAIMYEALTTHQIAGGYTNADGTQDIVFAVPAANKAVFDGSSAKQFYWSDVANALPVTNIVEAYDAMKVKPSAVVMNSSAYSYFMQNAEVVATAAHATKPQNFFINADVNPASEAFRAGRIVHNGVIIDVYVEKQTKKDGNPFLANGYVVLASPIGEMNYGGIPVGEVGTGVRNIMAEWDADEVVTLDPPQHKLVVRTAPLPTLKNGEGYYSMKTEA